MRAAALALALLTGVSPAAAAGDKADECRNDAMLVFDASGSMASTDESGNVSRIWRVRQAAAKVVPEVAPYRNLGLMVYGAGATNSCSDITLKVPVGPNNAGPIIKALSDVIPNGKTPLTESLARAAENLDFRNRPATIVLLTDGEENCDGKPCELARRLKGEGADVRIHVIDYKLRLGSDWRGTFQSRCLATETGGKYVPVDTTNQLIAALRDTLECPYVTELRRKT